MTGYSWGKNEQTVTKRTPEGGGMESGTWRLVVDGECFDVVERTPGVYDLTWLTGPNADYGFTAAASDGKPMGRVQLEEHARVFLRQVDPQTGHVEAGETLR